MKRLHLALAFLFSVLLSPPLSAQSGQQPPISQKTLSTTTCTVPSSAGCLIVGTSGSGGLGVQVTGTFVGTLSFYGSVDGVTYVAITGLPVASTTPVTSVTAPGAWVVGVGGLSYIKVAFSAYTSGTAVVSTRTALTTARTGVGGSSAGTIVGANTQMLFFNGANNPAGNANFIFNPSVAGIGGPLAAVGLAEQSKFVNSDWGVSGFALGPFATSGNSSGDLYLVGLGNQSTDILAVRHSGTLAAPTTTGDGTMVAIRALGYDGLNHYRSVADIQIMTDGAPSMSAVPGRIEFETSNSSDVGLLALRLDSNQIATFANAILDASAPTSITSTSVTTCGTTSPVLSNGSANSRGSFIVGATAATDCTLTFSVAASHAWVCVPSDETTAVLVRAVEVNSTSTKFQGVMTAGDKIGYLCAPY